MAKVDKSQYTKEQWIAVRQQRREAKLRHRQEKLIESQTKEFAKDAVENPITPPYNDSQRNQRAFVIGNGTSRASIDLAKLKQHGVMYGCNALYREFEPDYLIAVDTKMITEINRAGWHNTHEVWTNPNKSISQFKGFNFFRPSKGWSSGPTALWFAAQHHYPEIYILGFDYKGVGENNKFVNNLYAGTLNYKRTRDGATYFGNWLRQTRQVIKENPQKTFYRVIASDNYRPPELNNFGNLQTIMVEDFKKKFGLPPSL